MILYVATTNRGKLRDFAHSAQPQGIQVLPLAGLQQMPVPREDAATFAGNAALKAIAYSRLMPEALVLADDSGLEIAALDGRPGVHSARFADDLRFQVDSGLSKDERNNQCVLALVREAKASRPSVPPHARFVCALALAQAGEIRLEVHGDVEGELLDAPRGQNGFGYDPLFLLPHLGKAMAELDGAEKWAISHRGNAFRNLLLQLQTARLQSA